MKTKLFIVFVIGMLTTLVKSQTGSDYYLPLCVGNNTVLYCEGTKFWESRTIKYEIIRTDWISGEEYFLETASEINSKSEFPQVFHQFWLRKDDQGNIVMGAMDVDRSGKIENAQLINPPSKYFSNEFLNVGYSRITPLDDFDNVFYEEVISNSETVGKYNNCIKMKQVYKDASLVYQINEVYYANGVGLVKQVALYPENLSHTNNLVSVVANTCNLGVHSVVGNFETPLVIYPNPSTGLFNISNVSDGSILEVYNLFGQKIMSQKNASAFNLNGYPKGMYVVVLKNGKNVISQKVFLE